MLILHTLTMLVTSEPTAELDGAIADAARRRDRARRRGDARAAAALTACVDDLLDRRQEFAVRGPSEPAADP